MSATPGPDAGSAGHHGVPPAGPQGPREVDALLQQAWEIRHEDTRAALLINRQAHALAVRLDYARGVAYGLLRTGLCLLILAEPAHPADDHVRQAQALMQVLCDAAGEAEAVNLLGHLASRRGDAASALALYRDVLALRERLDDTLGQARALTNIGLALRDLGEYADALEHQHRALAIAEAHGDAGACGYALMNIGDVLHKTGEGALAMEHWRRSLPMLAATRDRAAESTLRVRLGQGLLQAGEVADAREHLERAVALSRQTGNRADLVEALSAMGELHQACGQTAAADERHREALDVAQGLADPVLQAELLCAQARAWHAAGRTEAARAALEEALSLAQRAGSRLVQAQAHAQLADVHEAGGHCAPALGHLRAYQALQSRELGLEMRRRVRDVLTRAQTEPLRQDAARHRARAHLLADELDAARRWAAEKESLLQQVSSQAALLEQLAREDGLTGVANRRWLDLHLARECERARRFGHPLAVAMIDIDHFKAVNDGCGHGVGDTVLRRVAQLLRDHCRLSDLVGRYGGEEFMLVLAETQGCDALLLCEKLRRQVSELDWSGLAPGLGAVTVSVGVAAALGDALLPAYLCQAADTALYAAKAAGRNRVMSAQMPR